jgi:hypothetical protein
MQKFSPLSIGQWILLVVYPEELFCLAISAGGILGAIPRFLSVCLSSLESYPLSVCRACGDLFGLPGFPVRTLTDSNKGTTCSLSPLAAPVEMIDSGLPPASSKACRLTPLPLKPYSTPSPPPFPAAKELSTEPRSQSIRPAFWASPNRCALMVSNVPSPDQVPSHLWAVDRLPNPSSCGTSAHLAPL